MAAVFGVVGEVSPAELDEMARRLAHRGGAAMWIAAAPGVYLGHTARQAPRVLRLRNLSVVIDAPESSQAHSRVCAALQRSVDAADLDRAVSTPFTFAAWDHSTRSLLLGRDFLGLKPLHYCSLPNGGVAFATEYKALLALGQVAATPDLAALAFLQVYKAVPPGRTLLAGVSTAPPGCVLHFSRDGKVLREDRMPEIRLDVRPMSEAEAAAQLRHALEVATRPLVAGRTRIGLALSGGVDSLSVAHLARKCAPDAELVAFTAGDGAHDPEVQRAAAAMERLGGRHEMLIASNEELLANMPLAVWHLENPIGRSETFQFLCLAHLARQRGFDFLLSGMGADLLFGGMPRHRLLWMAEAAAPLRGNLLELFEATQTWERPRSWIARLMMTLCYGTDLPAPPAIAAAPSLEKPELLAQPGPEFLNRCLMLDGQEPTSRTLARIERPLQAYGIEYGSPYLDKALIQYAFTMPGSLKIQRGVQKYILREAMRPLMDGALCKAPKELMRMRQSAAFAATLDRLADRYLAPERLRRRGWFEPDQVERVRGACRRPHHPETAMRLWTLLATEMWAEIYLDARGRCPAAAMGIAMQPERWVAMPTPAVRTA
jgi:asparagine synthase (glutamine-hydrolysing)